MLTKSVIATVEVHMTYTGESPVYRLYVGDELFAERTWIWADSYLKESIVLEAPYGLYPLRFELLPHADAAIDVRHPEIVSGPGKFRKNFVLVVHDETS